MLVRAIERAGCVPGRDAAISLDIAASEFGRDGRYTLCTRPARTRSRRDVRDAARAGSTAIRSCRSKIRFAEDDREAWVQFTRAVGSRVQVIGDDYLTTNAQRVVEAATDGACNAVLIKVNQAGTLTEAKAALDAGKAAGLRHHRLGALGRNRGHGDRAPRGRLERGSAEGRLVRAQRAHGEVERGAAHRGGAGDQGAGSRGWLACRSSSPTPPDKAGEARCRRVCRAQGASSNAASSTKPAPASPCVTYAGGVAMRSRNGRMLATPTRQRKVREHRRVVGRIAREHELVALARRGRRRIALANSRRVIAELVVACRTSR